MESSHNFSLKYIRRSSLVASLATIESDEKKIGLLIDKVMSLQDTLLELQTSYVEVCLNYKKLSEVCAQAPF